MTALFKALGVTIWSLAAVGLLFLSVALGYKAVRHAHLGTLVSQAPENEPSHAAPLNSPAVTSSPQHDTARANASSSSSGALEGAQSVDPQLGPRFRAAVARNDAEHIIQYGIRLDAVGLASATDLGLIAVAFFTIGDCANAQKLLQRSAPLAGNAHEWTAAQDWVLAGCNHTARTPLNPPPRPAGETGERDVHIGELYYGFNDYSRAVTYLEKGIRAGGLTHPADAYVYLGRSYLALGKHTQACEAFDQLQRLPEVGGRMRKLWALFADMHCRMPDPP